MTTAFPRLPSSPAAASLAVSSPSASSSSSSSSSSAIPSSSPSSSYQSPYSWRFLKHFGDASVATEDELITSLRYDQMGDHVAVGDSGGRVCIFRANQDEYEFFHEFTSHERDFDALRSETITEQIVSLHFLPRRSHKSLLLLAANERHVRLWRVLEKQVRKKDKRIERKKEDEEQDDKLKKKVAIPLQEIRKEKEKCLHVRTQKCEKDFLNASYRSLHSISPSSDGLTFLASDSTSINLWSYEHTDSCMNVLDMTPDAWKAGGGKTGAGEEGEAGAEKKGSESKEKEEESYEFITCATFHPTDPSLLAYATTFGNIHVVDLRDRALIDRPSSAMLSPSNSNLSVSSSSAVTFNNDNYSNAKRKQVFRTFSLYLRLVSSVSFFGAVPSASASYQILSRDYLHVKLWDLRMNRDEPVRMHPVHNYLTPFLMDLYENNCILDQFTASSSHFFSPFSTNSFEEGCIITGSYSNHLHVIDPVRERSVRIEAPHDGAFEGKDLSEAVDSEDAQPPPPDVQQMDFSKKTIHVACHPTLPTIAFAGLNQLFLYQGLKSSDYLQDNYPEQPSVLSPNATLGAGGRPM